MEKMRLLLRVIVSVLAFTLIAEDAPELSALDHLSVDVERMIEATGVKGGLCIQIGLANEMLTRRLVDSERFLVHGVDADVAAVERVRHAFQSKGLYGRRVSVERGFAGRLPHASNLANLVVVEHRVSGLDYREILRVLAPGGALFVGGGVGDEADLKVAGFGNVRSVAGGLTGQKPKGSAGEWHHWRGGAGDNAVSEDAGTDLPRRLQWLAHPRFTIGHKTAIVAVSARGRVFHTTYWLTPFLAPGERMDAQGLLVARDAFNGTLLWTRSIPRTDPREMVAAGERVLVKLKSLGPVVALDAATGETVQTFEDSQGTTDIRHSDGVVLLKTDATLLAMDATSSAKLWDVNLASLFNQIRLAPRYAEVRAADGHVYIHSPHAGAAWGFDLKTGRELWKRAGATWLTECRISTCGAGAVFFVSGGGLLGRTLYAVSGRDGRDLWRRHIARGNNYYPALGVFLRSERLFIHTDARGAYVELDAHTGEMKASHHYGVTRGTAGGKCAVENASMSFFVKGGLYVNAFGEGESVVRDLASMRSACRIGTIPANGLFYYFAHDCGCGAGLRGTAAMAPETLALPPRPLTERLERGQARPGSTRPGPDDWPTFRHDAARSGATSATIAGRPAILWTATVGGRPTPPTLAAGRVYVGSSDHRISAFDATTGAVLWRYTTDGPIRIPPTIYEGLCLAGSHDGWLYALNADTGELVWRLLAAPAERKIVAFDQIESAWPVQTGVLVQDGRGYVLAGRLRQGDGDGIYALAFDPADGDIIWEEPIREVTPAEMLVADSAFLYAYGALHKGGGRASPVRIDPNTGGSSLVKPEEVGATFTIGPHWEVHGRFSRWFYGDVRAERIVFSADCVYGAEWTRGWAARNTGERTRLFKADGWSVEVTNVQPDALILTGDKLVLATRSAEGADLRVIAASDGKTLGSLALEAPSIPCGLAAAAGRLFLPLENGQLACIAGQRLVEARNQRVIEKRVYNHR